MRQAERSAVQLAVRASLAATIAVVIAQALGLPGPIYALISGVMVTDLDPGKSRGLAFPRILGTGVGTVLGGLFAPAVAFGVWTVGPAIVAAMLAAHVLRKPEAARMAGYVCALVMLSHGGDAWSYAWWRCVETVIGIVAAIAVSMSPKLLRDDAAPPAD